MKNNKELTVEEINEEIIKTQIKNVIDYYSEKVFNVNFSKLDIDELEKFLREYGPWLTDNERQEIEALIEKMKKKFAKPKTIIVIEEMQP